MLRTIQEHPIGGWNGSPKMRCRATYDIAGGCRFWPFRTLGPSRIWRSAFGCNGGSSPDITLVGVAGVQW